MLSEYAASLLPRCTFDPAQPAVDCAVSGGADSLALLALAVFSGRQVTAYHVDHGIRPDSSSEAAVVQRAADALGAEFVSLVVTCPPGPNLEARARAARFAVLPAGVATGHTAEDQAETVLLNMLRGAGLDGMSAMDPGPRHPILSLRRSETVGLVTSLGFEVVSDPSNDDLSFRRNRVRHELIGLLSAIGDRDVVPILSRQALLMRDEKELLDELAAGLDATDVKAIALAPVPLSRRAVRTWIKQELGATYPVDAGAVERVLSVARGDTVACEITQGVRIRRSKGRLMLEK